MTDRWVNFDIELTVASEDVEVTASKAQKMDAMEKVVDALIEALEGSGFQAKHEPVLSAAWADVGDGPTTAETPDLSEAPNRPDGARTRPTGAPADESTPTVLFGNPVKLRFSERKVLKEAQARIGELQNLDWGPEMDTTLRLIEVLSRLGRLRMEPRAEPRSVLRMKASLSGTCPICSKEMAP